MNKKLHIKLLARVLKQIRKQKGLTQEDLSKALNLQPSTYSRIERGEVEMGFTTYLNIQNYYNINLHYLIDIELNKLSSMSAVDFITIN